MSYDEDHEDRDEEGTDFSESKKYSKVLKTLSESQVRTLKRFVNEGLLSDTAKETKNSKIEAIIKQLRRLSNTLDSTGDNMKPSKINELLHKIENGVMERLEDIQDLLVKQAEKVKESK
jgi:thiamine kinase-like enzyme